MSNSPRGHGDDFITLNPTLAPSRRRAEWLAREIRDAILEGRVATGSRLPTTRDLAHSLGFSRGVITDAYRRLADEGIVRAKPRAGTVVIGGAVSPGTPSLRPIDVHTPVAATDLPVDIDLTPGRPDLTTFPRAAWLSAERAALQAAPPHSLAYGDPRGMHAFREELASWLARVRGVRVDPDGILVTNGFAQALSLLADVLPREGIDTIAVEDPGSRGARDELAYWRIHTPPVPVDEEGLDVGPLHGSGARAVLTTPAHQFPTGEVLTARRRHELVAWAEQTDGLIIEDDYDAEHRYDRPPVPALHALAPDRVIYSGSVSKTLAPGIRLGWLVAPEALIEPLARSKYHNDLGSSAIVQLTVAELLRRGAYDRHIRALRTRHRQRRDAVVDAVRHHLPQARLRGAAAGLHVVLELPDEEDDEVLARRLQGLGVRAQPLSWHRQLPGPAGLVVGYATTSPDRLRDAVRRIAVATSERLP